MSALYWLAALDAGGGTYLIWYSRSRQQQRREPVLVVGVMLLIAATFLGYAGWHTSHRTVEVHLVLSPTL